jgi:ABC-type uncharacterized transport system permease subunit
MWEYATTTLLALNPKGWTSESKTSILKKQLRMLNFQTLSISLLKGHVDTTITGMQCSSSIFKHKTLMVSLLSFIEYYSREIRTKGKSNMQLQKES